MFHKAYPSDEGPASPSGIMLNFQFGGVRTINRIVGTGQPYATVGRYGDYWPDGSMATFLQGNGLGYHRVIDGAERTFELCYNNVPTNPPFLALCHGGPNLWESGVYQYDFAGNIAAIGADSFTYDRLARLKTAKINRHPHDAFGHGPQPAGFVSLNYAYDIFGNIKDRQLSAMSNYTVGQNPLEIFAGRIYTEGVNLIPDNKIHNPNFRYDGNGNLISDGVKDYIYDELNQQVEVRTFTTTCAAAGQGTGSFDSSANAGEGPGATPAGVLCYGKGTLIERNGYGADGMRAARDTVFIGAVGFEQAVKRTTYVRLGGNVIKEVTEEINTAKNLIQISHSKSYVYGPLGLLTTEELCSFSCKSDETTGANVTRYYEYDHLGTIRAITDITGNLETTFDYEPFGLELKGTTFTWGTDTSSNTHKFTGHERDEEAGEDYMKARMYVLSTARFPQIDPMFGGIGDPQNWNAYIYVGNSPVGASDPTGMLPNNDPTPPVAYTSEGFAAGATGFRSQITASTVMITTVTITITVSYSRANDDYFTVKTSWESTTTRDSNGNIVSTNQSQPTAEFSAASAVWKAQAGEALPKMAQAVDAIYKASGGDNNLAAGALGQSAVETQLGAGDRNNMQGRPSGLEPFNNPMSLAGSHYDAKNAAHGVEIIRSRFPTYQDKVNEGVNILRGVLSTSSGSLAAAIQSYSPQASQAFHNTILNAAASVNITVSPAIITRTLITPSGDRIPLREPSCVKTPCMSAAPPPGITSR